MGVDAYARAMKAQLMRPENAEKTDWDDGDHVELMNDVWYHAAKLLKATRALQSYQEASPANGMLTQEETEKNLRRAILEFAADVGNCAMIVADVTGALEHSEDDMVGEAGEEAVGWKPY